jgi:glycosyltransferase involved in cell wall biosynthesis
VTHQRVAVISHDAEQNAFGRALVIYDLLKADFDAEIVAFGDRIWAPGSTSRVRLIPKPRTNIDLPIALSRLRSAVREADLLVAVKPRPMSFGAALLAQGNRPLVLDIDDLEHLFVHRRFGVVRQLLSPDHEPATRLLERRTGNAAGIFVASRALQRLYGGTWMPHVRDRSNYADTALARRSEWRSRAEVGDAFVVGFIGTVRPHKGLLMAASAVRELRCDALLMIVGRDADNPDVVRIRQAAGGRLRLLPEVPLADLPGVLGACDALVIPQSPDQESHYQSPAKLLDAMAAGRPLIVSDIGDSAEIVGEAGILVPPGDTEAFTRALARLSHDAAVSCLGVAAKVRHDRLFDLAPWQHAASEALGQALAHNAASRARRSNQHLR